MSAYFDGPPSFFPGQAVAAASAAPLPGLEEAGNEHTTLPRERPVVPQQVTLAQKESQRFLFGCTFFLENWGNDSNTYFDD